MQEKSKSNSPTRAISLKRKDKDPALKGKLSRMFEDFSRPDRLRWFLLPLLSLIVSIALFPGILSKPLDYRLGDIADRDIKASDDFLVENAEVTEQNREKAVKEVLAVYDYDMTSSNLFSRIKDAFKSGREFLAEIPETPPGEETSKSTETPPPAETLKNGENAEDRFFNLLGIPSDPEAFKILLESGFPPQVEETVLRLTREVSLKGIVGNRRMLKGHIEKGGITLHDILSKKEKRAVDFDRFYNLESARKVIADQTGSIKKTIKSSQLTGICVKLAQTLIKPNLTFNQRETELRKDLARKSIKPTYFKIKKGEMIVREGERIEQEHLLKLSGQTRSQNRIDQVGRVPAMAILVGTLFLVIYLTASREMFTFRGDRRDLLFTAMTLLGIFIFAWAYHFIAEEVARGFPYFTSMALLFALPVAFGAMLISIFQGFTTAAAFSLITSVLVALITGGHVEFFTYYFIGSLLAAYGVKNCTERGILIKTGLMVGLINILLSLAIEMIYGSLYTIESAIAAAAGFAGGILSGVIATGIIPLIEMSFGFTTDIKLLELANLDQPLLRDLMVRSPGTYHHSVITSNMVEATAKAVNANPLLAKVSAYYHDIGKMTKPLYFIENQFGGENKHEKLAPSMSSLILISHVKDGVELAREHKLGKEIIDIIQQHHGTSLISFFYHKARERMVAKGNRSGEVKEEDFRYPGPKPQTKEAGLVMLADMVEAASRTIVDPTPSRIQGMVQKIINKVFSDGQLNECELTLKDLNEIAKSFNKTLSGIFHHRVEYPEAASKTSKKGKNGNSDQASKDDTGTKKPDDKAELKESLKRLGLS